MTAFIVGKVMLLSVPSHLCYISNVNNRMFMLKWFPYVEFTLVTPPLNGFSPTHNGFLGCF